ncbi:MAG TPA: Gfo/Idh/MocA family oxidoreductase [Bryobacteraceae bacterium]|nr:Gfo/Idh/MocA family oxidoreductase [Bryobacteraceae bacterium]
MKEPDNSTRREFLGRTALAGTLAATVQAKPAPKAASRVLGANDRINVAFIGNGMQFYGLLDRRFRSRKEQMNDFHYAAVCDVWEPRLKRAQEATKADKTYRDYREIIARPDIDGVVIAVPDHWHYLIASQALAAGKDVYLEKPMTYTIPEAAKLSDQVAQTKRVLQVGGTGPSTRLYWKVNEYIKSGKLGKVLWGLISYNRNTREGMWDYPIPGVGGDHWADAEVSPGKNLDWNMWIGPARKRPYSAERYFRWRKYWDYSGGNATDLLYHRLGVMSTMIGFDFPTRVTAAGGIYVQKNREVPDTYMTMVEYPGEYAVNMISCMGNQQSAPLSVYGNWGTVQITDPPATADPMGDQRRGVAGGGPPRQVGLVRAERQFVKEFQEANGGKTEVVIEPEPSPDLVDDWLDCMRSRGTTVYNALRGYQVMVAIRLGVDSYRMGRTMGFDPTTRRVLEKVPPHKEYLPPGA